MLNKDDNSSTHDILVGRLFNNIAKKYDILNRLLSLGLDISWRKKFIQQLKISENAIVLDLAAGTLDITNQILKTANIKYLYALDYSLPMLEQGKSKIKFSDPVSLVQADGKFLPIDDNCIDFVTISFGIRNIVPRQEAYAEIMRVLRPGGKFCILEFSSGKKKIWKGIYNIYRDFFLPKIGGLISKDTQAYEYLARTIREFPDADLLADELRQFGFSNVTYSVQCCGVVFTHIAIK